MNNQKLANGIAILISICAVLPASAQDLCAITPNCPVGVVCGDSCPNTMIGTQSFDQIWADGGDDIVVGLAGNDVLLGDGGNGTILCGAGRDIALGGSGIDTIDGGSGNDILFGQTGNDVLDGDMVTFFLVTGAGTDGVFVSVFGSVSGTSAPPLGSTNAGPNVSGAFNSVTFGPYVGVGSFLAGAWYVAGDTVGLGSGTVAPQGHHGMVINDIVGTGFATLPGLNALVRASTGFIVPVELQNFSINDED